MRDDIRSNYKLGKQQQNFRDRDRDEYAGVNDFNDTINYGEQENSAYREKLDRERRRNATWYPKYPENYDDAFAYFNNLRGTGTQRVNTINQGGSGNVTTNGDTVTQGGGSGTPSGSVVTQGGGGSGVPSGDTVTQSGGSGTPSGNTVTQSGGSGTPSSGSGNQGEFEVQRPWDDFRKRQGIMPNPNLVDGEGKGTPKGSEAPNNGDGKITPINKSNPQKGKMYQHNRGQGTDIDRLKLKKDAEEKMMNLRMYNAGTPQYPNWQPRDKKRSNDLKAKQKAAKKEWMRYANNVGIRENKIQKIVSESIKKVLNEQNRKRHK
jgi:hypothetical protein